MVLRLKVLEGYISILEVLVVYWCKVCWLETLCKTRLNWKYICSYLAEIMCMFPKYSKRLNKVSSPLTRPLTFDCRNIFLRIKITRVFIKAFPPSFWHFVPGEGVSDSLIEYPLVIIIFKFKRLSFTLPRRKN